MKRLLRLCILYFKTAFACMGRALIFSAAILVIAALLLWGTYKSPDGGISVADIGIVSEDNSSDMRMLIKIIRQMPFVKGACSLEEYSKSEAMDALKSGKLQMIMEIPENFVTDLDHMRDTAMTLYVPSGDVLANDRIYAMLSSAESLMITTECAICSMYEGMEYYTYDTTVSKMEEDLFKTYIKHYLNREDTVKIEYLSAYGNYDSFLYYGISAILIILVLLGAFMLRGYSKNMLETERLIATNIKDKIILCIFKIICFSAPYMVLGSVLYAIFYTICQSLEYEIYNSPIAYLVIFIISVSASAFVHLYSQLVKYKEGREILYVLIVTLVWIISGAMLWGNIYLPLAAARFALLSAGCDFAVNKAVAIQIIYLSVFAGLAVWLSVKPIRWNTNDKIIMISKSQTQRKSNLYVSWLLLTLKQNLTSYVFWLECAILVLTMFTVHFLTLKISDSNRVIYVSNENNREIVEALCEAAYSGFDYEEVLTENEFRREVIRGEALAGIEAEEASVTLYAPTGSYSAVILRELIFPHIFRKQSSIMLREYLQSIGVSENDVASEYVLNLNKRLNDEMNVDIFKIREISDVQSMQHEKVDFVLVSVMILIAVTSMISIGYELKSHRGFLKSKPVFVRITLMAESGIVKGLLLCCIALIVVLII